MQGSLQTIRNSILFTCTALLLATNYFAFQAELFDAEYEANHPIATPSHHSSISAPSFTWESFDKDNAPQAFVVDPELRIQCLLVIHSEDVLPAIPDPPFAVVRDKSPPPPHALA